MANTFDTVPHLVWIQVHCIEFLPIAQSPTHED